MILLFLRNAYDILKESVNASVLSYSDANKLSSGT